MATHQSCDDFQEQKVLADQWFTAAREQETSDARLSELHLVELLFEQALRSFYEVWE